MEHLSEDFLYGLISQACDYVPDDITSTIKNKLDDCFVTKTQSVYRIANYHSMIASLCVSLDLPKKLTAMLVKRRNNFPIECVLGCSYSRYEF